MLRLINWSTTAFPLWILVGGALALVHPTWFTWFSGPWIVWGLAVIMLGMGLTLRVEDFRDVAKMPRAALLGVLGQFTIMPTLGWLIATVLNLDTPFAVGLILVSCCPGGTASNVVAFLARANVALSVVMTMVSTCAAVVMTPLLTQVLAGTMVAVDGWGLFLSTLQVVVAPVVVGVSLGRYAPRAVQWALPVAPLVSVVAIVLIVASIIGQSAAAIIDSALQLLSAVFVLHVAGFGLGYSLAKLLSFDDAVARTTSIEVGMQNSGLGVVLARAHFSDPLTAVPCAISSVFHSVIGSILAGLWRMRPTRGTQQPSRAASEASPAS